jgi:hypothetical protein
MAARLFSEFTSSNQIDYVVEIHDTEFSGAAQQVSISGDGFQINWDGEVDEIYSPIIGSSASFTLYDNGEQWMSDFIDLFKQYQEERFFVVIYREAAARYVNNLTNVSNDFEARVAADGGDVESPTCYKQDIIDLGNTFRYIGPIADHIYWFGWIVQDLIEVEDISNPTQYAFKAVDGISKMSSKLYEYAGSDRTIVDHIYNIINDNTPAQYLTQTLPLLRTISNYWAEEQTYSATTNPLSLTRFQGKTFTSYNDDGSLSYTNGLDILRQLCLSFGARFYFDDGEFRFEQFSERQENQLREFKYLMDGTADGYEDVAVDFDVDQIAVHRSKGVFRYLPAVSKIELTEVKSAHISIIGRPVLFPNSGIDVGLIPSADNGRITLEMKSQMQINISNPLQGTATPLFGIEIKLTPADGSAVKYWKNSLIVNSLVFGPGSWSTTQDTYKWAGNTVSRSVSAKTTTAHTMVTGPLPTDGQIDIDISFLGFYDFGLDPTFITSPNTYSWSVLLDKARFENDNSPSSVAEVIGFATNPSTKVKSNLTLSLGKTKLFNGSGEIGSLYVYNGTMWVPSGEWRKGNLGDYNSISLLVTSDIMQFHNSPIERWEGEMIYPENYKSLLRFNGDDWIAMRATLSAENDVLQGEWFRIAPDDTNVTIGTPIDVVDTNFGGNDAADFSGRYSNTNSGSIGGMVVDYDNNALGPFSETSTGGAVDGNLNVSADVSIQRDLSVDGAALTSSMQLAGGTGTQGTMEWNGDEDTIELQMNGASHMLGQDMVYNVKNQTGSTIDKGVAVMAVGTLGSSGRILIARMDASGDVPARFYLGVTTEAIANGADGKVIEFGKIRGIDTSSYGAGDVLWLSPTTDGAFTATEPPAPNLKIATAFVINSHANNGVIMVRANQGHKLQDAHDVRIGTLVDGDILRWDAGLQVWYNTPFPG